MNGRLDMDGVIANCTLAIATRIGADYHFDVTEDGYGFRYEEEYGYDIIRQHLEDESFWSEMLKYSWSDDIVELFEKHFGDDWIFLTKGFHHKSSLSGKYMWIEKHYPQHLDKLHICIGRNKYVACDGPNSFLLDDTKYNIGPWRAKGGLAYHWIEMAEVTYKDKINERIRELDSFLQRGV